MDLYFERGSRETPKGHALVYFRQRYNQDEIMATYIITLPIKVDVSKYIPPMFAAQIQGMNSQELSGFAFPPFPEKVDSLAEIQRLADARDDDLIDGGTGDANNPLDMVQTVNDLQQEYTRLWQQSQEASQPPALSGEPNVNELLYELMGETGKLSELAKLVGKMRFGVEGSDSRLVKEAEEEILTLAKHLPEHYRVPRIIQVAEMPADMGATLAQLYLERCYKLYEEDYRRIQEVDVEIRRIEEGMGS